MHPRHLTGVGGSTAYSYCFRIGYVAGIHVLTKWNLLRETFTDLDYDIINAIIAESDTNLLNEE